MKLHSRRPQNRLRGISPSAAAFFAGLLVLPALASVRLAQLLDARLMVAYFGAVSAVTLFLYWRDKRSAEDGTWRTPELTLHLTELFGGWPAAFIAQRVFRHKISKRSYQVAYWAIVAAHQAAAFDFLYDWHYTRATLVLLQT